jgi:aspartyl-tRNA(Asn)/glutamyl-tRNA(Gln) amidotransferase subunit C
MGASSSIDVGYIASLSRIELDPADKERLQHDMEAIIGYIEQLSELNVDGIEPTAHAVPMTNVWREDRAGAPFDRDAMLKNAPATIDEELLKVPQVLPGEGMA